MPFETQGYKVKNGGFTLHDGYNRSPDTKVSKQT
jgi:hypothetical protein